VDKIKWGMIGCGDVTETKNGPGLYKCRDSELFGITNRTIARARDWVKRHGHGRVFESAEELLACPEIDIVYVATTPDTHREFAQQCARAGKHCYLEKPVAPDYEDAVEIQKAFTKANKRIFVAHYRRAMPRIQKIKALIEKISPVNYVRVVRTGSQKAAEGWRGNPRVSGGGVFFETEVHSIDLLDYLFGPLKNCQFDACEKSGPAPEEYASLMARGRDNILINGIWRYFSPANRDICEAAGERGFLSFPVMGEGSILYIENKGEALNRPGAYEDILSSPNARKIVFHPEEHAGQPMEQTIVDELLGRGTCPSTLETAMRSLKICCDMRRHYHLYQ
jgi:predicted dehydrogenase